MIIYLAKNIEHLNEKGYIGQTTHSLKKRWSQHLNAAFKKNSQDVFHKAIRKYGKNAWKLEILEVVGSKKDLNEKEIEFIEKYNTHYLNGNGYNMCIGGRSRSGWKEEPAKTVARIAKQLKPVVCIETGKVFESIKAAALELKVSAGFLRNVCAGLKPTAKGFTFKYLYEDTKNKLAEDRVFKKEKYKKEHFTSGRPVVCLSNGNRFISVKQAARQLGVAEVNMYKHLKKLRKTCKGLIFSYEDQVNKENIKCL